MQSSSTPTDSVIRMPRTIVTGCGTSEGLHEHLTALHVSRPLIVTDRGLREVGLVDRALAGLASQGIEAAVFDDVSAEPPFEVVDTAASKAIALGCDAVIGVGGGSSLDCAKGTALIAKHGGRMRDYVNPSAITGRGLPTIMVPTTAGTGSEVTAIAVFTDLESDVKLGVVSPHLIPDIAIIDPLLTLTTPRLTTAYTGIDALTHAIEAFVSVKATPVTDALASEAIVRVSGSLREVVANGANRAAREAMSYGSLLAGMAFAAAGVAAVHALAYPLGARYPLPHGLCNGLLLPYVMQANWIAAPGKFARIAALMGRQRTELAERDLAMRSIDAVRELSTDIGLPTRLRDVAVTHDTLDAMADTAAGIQRLLQNNPRNLGRDDIRAIYESAF